MRSSLLSTPRFSGARQQQCRLTAARLRCVAEAAAPIPRRTPHASLSPREAVEALLTALVQGETSAAVETAFAFALRPSEGSSRAAPSDLAQGDVLGWVPRRTRLVAPSLDRSRFEQSLLEPPYVHLLRADAARVVGQPSFRFLPGAHLEECEMRVISLQADVESEALRHEWTIRLAKPADASQPRAGCWLVKHVEPSGGWWRGVRH
jgi:hypothetical protein